MDEQAASDEISPTGNVGKIEIGGEAISFQLSEFDADLASEPDADRFQTV